MAKLQYYSASNDSCTGTGKQTHNQLRKDIDKP